MKPILAILTLFAVSMALLEAAVVVYARRLYYPDNPLELFPLEFLNHYDPLLELSREAATILMIVAVALLADRTNWTRCFAAFVFVFGMWDVFYYVWLKVLMGWPRTWMEWDVLFLIPTIWLGPWICPVQIALLFVAWGYWTLMSNQTVALTGRSLLVFAAGAGFGLVTFMQPAAAVMIEGGEAALSQYVPGRFWWWLFWPSYVAMAIGLWMSIRKAEIGKQNTVVHHG